MLCCQNKILPLSACTFSRTSLSNSLSPLIHGLGNTAAPFYPLQEPGSCIPHHSLFTIKQISAQTYWHTLCLKFTSPFKNLTSLFFTTALMSQCLLVCYSNSSQHYTLRKAQALAPHCNCKDYLIKHPFLTLVSFLLPPSSSSLTSVTLSIFLSIVTTLILDQQEGWG